MPPSCARRPPRHLVFPPATPAPPNISERVSVYSEVSFSVLEILQVCTSFIPLSSSPHPSSFLVSSGEDDRRTSGASPSLSPLGLSRSAYRAGARAAAAAVSASTSRVYLLTACRWFLWVGGIHGDHNVPSAAPPPSSSFPCFPCFPSPSDPHQFHSNIFFFVELCTQRLFYVLVHLDLSIAHLTPSPLPALRYVSRLHPPSIRYQHLRVAPCTTVSLADVRRLLRVSVSPHSSFSAVPLPPSHAPATRIPAALRHDSPSILIDFHMSCARCRRSSAYTPLSPLIRVPFAFAVSHIPHHETQDLAPHLRHSCPPLRPAAAVLHRHASQVPGPRSQHSAQLSRVAPATRCTTVSTVSPPHGATPLTAVSLHDHAARNGILYDRSPQPLPPALPPHVHPHHYRVAQRLNQLEAHRRHPGICAPLFAPHAALLHDVIDVSPLLCCRRPSWLTPPPPCRSPLQLLTGEARRGGAAVSAVARIRPCGGAQLVAFAAAGVWMIKLGYQICLILFLYHCLSPQFSLVFR
ncbi:hypothetical protein K438DRAFT_1977053 [Mycena galopus ATCC 62051]|nr:hypothetical protein K438DRAFT_1977053 [Mycena galopus ATCC 62051]